MLHTLTHTEEHKMQQKPAPVIKSYKIVSSNGMMTTAPQGNMNVSIPMAEPVRTETDEEIIERLRTRFNILDDMTRAVKKGNIRALIVSGPPGVGKSFGVERVLGKHKLMTDLAGIAPKYDIVKGSMTALGLYAKLYEYSKPGNILVFDDCDQIFFDDLSLNLLKAALDSGKSRRLNWLSDSRMLKAEGIPNSFDFHGGVVFITNMDFDNVRSPKLRPHIEALESRCLYLDLTIKSDYDKMLRIKQIVKDGMLKDFDFSPELEEKIINYVEVNRSKLRELSLRTVLKVAGLAQSFPHNWEEMSKVTIFRKEHSF